MKLSEMARLTALLSRLARESKGPRPDVEEQLDRSAGAFRYDLYRPRRPARGLVVAIHGTTLLGNRDARLVHFARALGVSRVACATPLLPGLASCRWRTEDIDALSAVALDAAQATGCDPVLVGFSFGGSYALLAAARPPLAGRAHFVVTFGAFHAMGELFDGYVAAEARDPADEEGWDNWIYLHLVLADQYTREASISPEVHQQARELLGRYCHGATAQEKRRFFERHLRGRGLVELGSRQRDRALLAALSPAGQLDELRARVSLIHDRTDTLVPPDHGERLQRELGERAELVITSLLQHVSLADMLRLGDLSRLYRALAPLVRDGFDL